VNVSLDGVRWKPSPARHEGGTPNLVGAVALAAGLEALHELGYEQIVAHETKLHRRLERGLRALGISLLRIWPERRNRVAVASFTVPGYRADLVAAYLSAEHGIGVRGGRFCAHPLLERLGLADDGAVRASIGLGTSGDDVDALLSALERLVSYGPSWTYATDPADGLVPSPDPRPSMVDAVLAGRFAVLD
jgi:selenocysteine lyase/cysteine desulfurase